MNCCFLIMFYIFLAASILFCVSGSADAEPAKEMSVKLPGGSTMKMVWVNPGTFIMGSPYDEESREENESQQHEVNISKGFWMGKYEVTQEQWESVMNTRPWDGQVFAKKAAEYPAVYISWNDAQKFIAKLNAGQDSEIYRLPTEAEWEYACRAGTQTPYSYGSDLQKLGDYAWHGKNTYEVKEMYAHKVGQKMANQWELNDMHGNVWEWVQDYYAPYSEEAQIDPTGPETGSQRVFRGGSFYYLARFARSAYRGYNSPRHRLFNLGVRVLRQEK